MKQADESRYWSPQMRKWAKDARIHGMPITLTKNPRPMGMPGSARGAIHFPLNLIPVIQRHTIIGQYSGTFLFQLPVT